MIPFLDRIKQGMDPVDPDDVANKKYVDKVKSDVLDELGGGDEGELTITIDKVTGLQTALDSKAPLASPNLTGTPTAPTAAAGTNTDQIASTKFVSDTVNTALNNKITYGTNELEAGTSALTTGSIYTQYEE